MSSITPQKRSADGTLSPPPTDDKGHGSPYLVSGWSATKRVRDSLPTPASSSRSTPSKRTIKEIFPTPSPKPIFNALPTPPRTPSHRKSNSVSHPDIAVPFPSHLNGILSLAKSFDLSLSLHLATHPPILPPLPPSTPEGLEVVLENVATYLGIKDSVERISGKRFGIGELRALMWLWEWDGSSVEGMKNGKRKSDNDNPFLVSSSSSTTIKKTNSPYILTPTRALDAGGRRVHTYGIGIRLHLTPSEVLSAGNTLLGPLGVGSAAAVGAVGRWSADGKSREVEGKLRRWVDIWGERDTGLPTPTKTPSNDIESTTIPPIPLTSLPQLPQSTGNLLPAFTLSSEALPKPSTSIKPSHAVTATEEDVFGPVVALTKPVGLKGPVKPGSVEERRQALYERIKARSNNVNIPSAAGRSAMNNVSSAEAQNVLKRRSTLSRLEGVAESVWMLFSMSTPSSGTNSPAISPRARRRAFPMSEVADIVVKSSKSPISSAEARDSLLLLTQLCPFFLVPRTVARQEWLEMPSAGAQHVERMTISPGGKLVGPTSPGKVVRGGLREVRERIRRELGE